VKLIDFGLAKLLDEHLMPTMTQTGLGPMTPVYAAPEQFEGKATTVATDIYQFGVLCFLVLSGSLPYRPSPDDSLRWARAVLEEEPMTLARAARMSRDATSEAPERQRRADLPADLDAIVRKCLAKKPVDRYQSADSLIGDIEAFLAGRPVTAHAAGLSYFAWRFAQRHRYAVSATVAAILAISTAGVAAFWQSRVAAEHAEQARREAEIRDITGAMLTDLLRAGPASATSERPHSALEALDQGTERTLAVLGSNSQHRAIAAGVLAQSYLDLEHPQRARELVASVLASLTDAAELGAEHLRLELLLARSSVELGDTDASRHALAIAESQIDAMNLPSDAPQRLAAAMVRVQIDRHAGLQEHAREVSLKLIRDFDHPDVNQSLEFADLLRATAKQTYDDVEAAAFFERAWKITSSRYGNDSPAALADERNLISRDHQGPRRLDTIARLDAQEARIRAAFGDQSLDYADTLYIRCEIDRDQQRYLESADCWRRVLAIYEKAPDADTLLAVAYDNLASALLKGGRPGEALPWYERELAVRSKSFAPGNQNVIHSRLQIAKTRCLAGDIARATQEWDEAIDDYVVSVGPLHPWEAVYAAYFATCLLDANRVESARSIMLRHGSLDPPRKNITDEDRDDVQKVWDRLARIP
jgi:eukaryotic-like serine/threonine-protein kinase